MAKNRTAPAQKLTFGGPNLGAGAHTWVTLKNGAPKNMYPGDSIDPSQIQQEASYYVDAGFASLSTDEAHDKAPTLIDK